jgi:hypothetical protein
MRGKKPEIPAIVPLDAAKHQKPMRPIHQLVFPPQLVVLITEQAKKDPVFNQSHDLL